MKKSNGISSMIRRVKDNVSLLALASCTLGMNILMILFSFYYVKVFLEHYHISSSWMSLAQTVCIVCNFVIGPFIAYAQDYGFEVFKNRRRLILMSGPLFALVFMIPWVPLYSIQEPFQKSNWAPGVHLMVVLVIWNVLFAILSSANNGLFAEFSTDPKRRVTALTCNQVAASIAASAVFPVDTLSNSVDNFTAFQICCGVVAAIAIACFVFTGFNASDVVAQTGRGRVDVEDVMEDEKKKMMATDSAPQVQKAESRFKPVIAYLTTVWQVLRTRNYVCAALANFMSFLRVCVINNFFAVYTQGLISESILPTGSILMGAIRAASQVTPRLIFVLCCPIIRWVGAYRALQSALVLTWVNCAAGIYLGYFVCYDALIGTLLLECILAAFQELFVMFYSEVVDQDAKRYNRKMPASTIIFTMTALFIQPSTQLAPMIVLQALNIGDYDTHKSNIRNAPPYTKDVMFLVAMCLPAVASIISFCSMCLYKTENTSNKDRGVITKL